MFLAIKSFYLRKAFIKCFLAMLFLSINALAVADAGSSYYRNPLQSTQNTTPFKFKKTQKKPWYERVWKWIMGNFALRTTLLLGTAKLIKFVIDEYKRKKI